MLILSVAGLMVIAALVAVWFTKGGQQWQTEHVWPITYLYDPTGEYTYMKDNPKWK